MDRVTARNLFAEHERDIAGLVALDAALDALASASDLGTRVEALEELAAWIRAEDGELPWPAGDSDPAGGDARYRRLGVFVVVLERSEDARRIVSTASREALVSGDALALYAEVGLAEHRGVVDEALERLQRRMLPAPRDERDLGRLIGRLIPDEKAADWLERAPQPLVLRLVHALAIPEESLARVREALGDALRLLSARAEAIGLSRALRERRAHAVVRDTPWYMLPRRTESLVARFERLGEPATEEAALAWRETIALARAQNREVLDTLETSGISVDIVFAVEAAERMLDRITMLGEVRLVPSGEARIAAGTRVVAILARERARSGSITALARDTSRQLARRVVERAGASGEHYIASNAAEYARMWGSAAWGGVLTVFTAAGKIAITAAHMPALPEGLAGGLNYAASFTLLQATHGTLATKQPSMTAATLAGILEESSGAHRAEEMATFVARIVRSQLAAALGNVTAVAIGAFAFDRLWLAMNGHHFVTAEKAETILASMHVFQSATIWYAALTGVLLWLASVTAGAIENWTAYRRIPRAIAEHRIGARFGRARMERAASWFARNVSAYAGSIVLGFFLGLAPAIGKFTGLPIDVRHVTLSTGQVAFAAAALGTFFDPRVAFALAGVACMFVLNLGVSFALALWVAQRARGVGLRERRLLRGAVLRRLMTRPHEFVLPSRQPKTADRQ